MVNSSPGASPGKKNCPACGRAGLEAFYRLPEIPVNSCLLLESAERARRFPCADLVLAVCPSCGFISNAAFDVDLVTYASQYEDQQSFSATFNSFAGTLAARLVRDFDLRDKDIVEVGCGRGDFLELLCELGGNRGIGIDPSISPRQSSGSGDGAVRWVAEEFHERHRDYPADFFCCRHTLEHIYDVRSFMALMREVIGNRAAPLFLEVPDTERVLHDGAFEDIYYEHCSYFTPGSLARLARDCGFDTTRLEKVYADQYLVLEALPAPPPRGVETEPDGSIGETIAAVETFRRTVDDKQHYWSEILHRYRDQPVALWGSGSKCVSLLATLQPANESITVVDINPHRHGKFLPGSGLEIQAPSSLKGIQPQLVIAMNAIYRDEIQQSLDTLGVDGSLLAL